MNTSSPIIQVAEFIDLHEFTRDIHVYPAAREALNLGLGVIVPTMRGDYYIVVSGGKVESWCNRQKIRDRRHIYINGTVDPNKFMASADVQ